MPITPEQFEDMRRRTERARGIIPDAPENAELTAKSLLDAVTDEERLHNDIIKFCRDAGWIYFHGSMKHRTYRTVGEADFCCLLPNGVTLFVECKRRGGKLSPEQAALKAWMAKLGHTLHVVYSIREFKELCQRSLNTPGTPTVV